MVSLMSPRGRLDALSASALRPCLPSSCYRVPTSCSVQQQRSYSQRSDTWAATVRVFFSICFYFVWICVLRTGYVVFFFFVCGFCSCVVVVYSVCVCVCVFVFFTVTLLASIAVLPIYGIISPNEPGLRKESRQKYLTYLIPLPYYICQLFHQ